MSDKAKAVLLTVRTEWECPNCTVTDVTDGPVTGVRFHNCAGLGGLSAPLVDKAKVGSGVQVTAEVREDYIGNEKGLTYDENGQPIMAVVTEYSDGRNDAAVFLPVARAERRKA